MRGVVFLGDRQLELREFPDPTPGPGEVVIEMKASGMCGSDLMAYRPPRGQRAMDRFVKPGSDPNFLYIAGHEPCGVVLERGPGVTADQAPTGQRVMIHHYTGCGRCKHCLVGYAQMCLQGSIVYGFSGHGGHAPYMVVKPHMLVPMPDEITFSEGAAISCGTGTAYLALKRLDVSGRDTLVVFGQGPVGLSATLLGKAMGARVVAVDLSAERRDLGLKFGADHVIDPKEVDPAEAVRALTHGEGASTTLDCTGNPDARVAAVRSAAIWGRVCFVGEGNTTTFEVSPDIIHKQLTIYGSWTFSVTGQAECAQFVADRRLPVDTLFTHRWSLDQADEAYRLFDTQTTGKGVFLF
ncbi:MAG TPA: zinc-binding dehydrogenase [Dehalococcoidia bacterium]|nr:zinc-binding dehydrogenase [Dehalococcoidia bacterium]